MRNLAFLSRVLHIHVKSSTNILNSSLNCKDEKFVSICSSSRCNNLNVSLRSDRENHCYKSYLSQVQPDLVSYSPNYLIFYDFTVFIQNMCRIYIC